MTKTHAFNVSKTDAAKRQLETAIRLWFFSQDPISVHTLAAAAHQVLHDLGAARGTPTILRGLGAIPDKYKERVYKAVSSYENFFKHGTRDPNKILNFNPDVTEAFLLDSVIMYMNLTNEDVPMLSIFKAWMFLKHPQFFNPADVEKVKNIFSAAPIDFTKISKMEFFTTFFEAFVRLGLSS